MARNQLLVESGYESFRWPYTVWWFQSPDKLWTFVAFFQSNDLLDLLRALCSVLFVLVSIT